MPTAHSVTIGHEFFQKAKRDYSSWAWAIAREFGQNSADAGSTEIRVKVEAVEDGVAIEVSNNGSPMTREILVGKLLSLGSTGKGFAGTVGGFGRAKEILYFAHNEYSIRTGTLRVDGIGGEYDLTEDLPIHQGTTSRVVVTEVSVDVMVRQFRSFVALSGWKGSFFVNDVEVTDRLRKGYYRKDFAGGAGKIYTNREPRASNLYIVRIGGLPMFSGHSKYKHGVVVELTGDSAATLQSNRDALLYQYGSELQDFITQLSVDTSSALRGDTVQRHSYKGFFFQHQSPQTSQTSQTSQLDRTISEFVAVAVSASATSSLLEVLGVNAPLPNRPAFSLINYLNFKTPKRLLPEGFDSYSKKLLARWTAAVRFAVDVAGITGKTFSLGFAISDDSQAEYSRDGDHSVFSINPVEVKHFNGKRKLYNRWTFDKTGQWQMVATALHEVAHMAGNRYHDESFSTYLTGLMAKALERRSEFSEYLAQAK